MLQQRSVSAPAPRSPAGRVVSAHQRLSVLSAAVTVALLADQFSPLSTAAVAAVITDRATLMLHVIELTWVIGSA